MSRTHGAQQSTRGWPQWRQLQQNTTQLSSGINAEYGGATSEREEGPLTKKGYQLQIRATIDSNSPLAPNSISSPTHKIVSEVAGDTVNVKLDSGETEMTCDFVLHINASLQSTVLSEIWDGPDGDKLPIAAVACFIPAFSGEYESSTKSLVALAIDCSASMAGVQFEQAKEGASHLLKMAANFPSSTELAVCAFGSSLYTPQGSKSATVSSSTLSKATQFLSTLAANRGGSQFYRVLKHLKELHTSQSIHQFVFLFTDGAVSQSVKVTEEVKAMASFMTIFPIAIGHGVSTSFLRGLARVTQGAAEFCTAGEGVVAAVGRQVSRAFAAVSSPTIQWPGAAASTATAPQKLSPVISNCSTTAFALLPQASPVKSVSLGGTVKKKTISYQCEVTPPRKGKVLHRLCAREIIRQLEDSKQPVLCVDTTA
eukprot:TRINITY_DN2449_c0_g4_i2.p1 TRINITY_DN2449_c0_g4~~TRINITY_DN2449_c0_g4_i2.p1  ORF type:complete len:427 (+),score=69.84 TRINITY_DN2449_c0_g4_i2:451-1731(+)